MAKIQNEDEANKNDRHSTQKRNPNQVGRGWFEL